MSRYDTITEVRKFNPYHGADGRFTTASGASSFTFKPGKSKAHDRAIQRAQSEAKAKKTPKLSYEKFPFSTLWGNSATPAEKKQKNATIKRFISEAKVGNVYAYGNGFGTAGGTFEIVHHSKSPNKMGIKSGHGHTVALTSANAAKHIANGAHLVKEG